MAFKKAKPTFLMSAGRLGAPSARKPIAQTIKKGSAAKGAYAMAKKTSRKPIGKATVVKNGGKLKTGKLKGALNSYRMSKAVKGKTSSVPMSKAKRPLSKKESVDSRLSSYFMSRKAGY